MGMLPSGTVTFLFTDLERSTALWEQQTDSMHGALARHDELLAGAIEANGGHVIKRTGDGFHAVFATAPAALAGAVGAQRALEGELWTTASPLRARMGLHTGVAEQRGDDYYGRVLNEAARLMDAGHGGQILVSRTTWELVRDALPEGCELIDLGEHRLRGVSRPMGVGQVAHRDLPRRFPPLRLPEVPGYDLPVQLSTFVGREAELDWLENVLAEVRLLTLDRQRWLRQDTPGSRAGWSGVRVEGSRRLFRGPGAGFGREGGAVHDRGCVGPSRRWSADARSDRGLPAGS